MTQTRAWSLIEASANTASGFVISWLVGMVVYPLLGWSATAGQTATVVDIFTVISIVRSYLWRRAFNRFHHKESQT
jgi:membrane protein implicated in regulation of membrane protease activity